MTEKKEAASWTNVGSSVAMTQSWGVIESTGDGKVGTLEVTHSFKGSYYLYPADCPWWKFDGRGPCLPI